MSRRYGKKIENHSGFSMWDKNDPAIYPHFQHDHWVKLKYKTPSLSIMGVEGTPPVYKESRSRFNYDGCLQVVRFSKINAYLKNEYLQMKPEAYPTGKSTVEPQMLPQYSNQFHENSAEGLKYWIDIPVCNLCPIVKKKEAFKE